MLFVLIVASDLYSSGSKGAGRQIGRPRFKPTTSVLSLTGSQGVKTAGSNCSCKSTVIFFYFIYLFEGVWGLLQLANELCDVCDEICSYVFHMS